jgi:hypothetical protein
LGVPVKLALAPAIDAVVVFESEEALSLLTIPTAVASSISIALSPVSKTGVTGTNVLTYEVYVGLNPGILTH